MSNQVRELTKFLAEYTRLATSDPSIAEVIAERLIEEGWFRLKDVSDLITAMKNQDMRDQLRGMGRSNHAEFRHVVRYVKEDLSSLLTVSENVSPGWEAAFAIEIAAAVGRLNALLNYMTKKLPEVTEVSLPEGSGTA